MSFGSLMNVPRPWVRVSLPSTTSSASACRTVVREVSKRTASSRSVGSAVPGSPASIIASRSCLSR
jgi:hypothetical protein